MRLRENLSDSGAFYDELKRVDLTVEPAWVAQQQPIAHRIPSDGKVFIGGDQPKELDWKDAPNYRVHLWQDDVSIEQPTAEVPQSPSPIE